MVVSGDPYAGFGGHYDEMARFCHFYRISPQEFWDLDMLEYRALAKHYEQTIEAQDRAARRQRRGIR